MIWSIFKLLIKIIIKILKWIKAHMFGVLAGSAAVGASASAIGVANAHKAKKLNKEAIAIQQTALEKHDKAYDVLQRTLAELGDTEKMALDSFQLFADTIGRIQDRPKIKMPLLSRVKLANYEPEELKHLSTGVQLAIGTSVGAGAGALAGLAAFGASAVAAAPAMITAGTVLCVKGCGLKKKAIENKSQAQKMSESVNELVTFYSRLGETAHTYRDCVQRVYNKYMECLNRVLVTLIRKTAWKEFSREERKNTENAVLLARMLYQMCKTRMIIQQSDAERIEEINTTEIASVKKDAQQLLARCA